MASAAMNLREITQKLLHLGSAAPRTTVTLAHSESGGNPSDTVLLQGISEPSAAVIRPMTTPPAGAPLRDGVTEMGFRDGTLQVQMRGTIAAAGLQKLVLRGSGDVEVETTPQGDIQYECQLTSRAVDRTQESARALLDKLAPLRTATEGNTATLNIHGTRPSSGLPAWARAQVPNSMVGAACNLAESAVDLNRESLTPTVTKLRVPAGMAVQIESSNGDVRVNGAASLEVGEARNVSANHVSGLVVLRDKLGHVTLEDVGVVEMRSADSATIHGAEQVTGDRIGGNLSLVDARDVHFNGCGGSVTAEEVGRINVGSVSSDVTASQVGLFTADRVGGDLRLQNSDAEVSERVGKSVSIRGGKLVKLCSVGGDVQGEQCAGLRLEISNLVSGALRASDVGTVEVGAVGGDLRVQNAAGLVVEEQVSGNMRAADVASVRAGGVGKNATMLRGQVKVGRIGGNANVDEIKGSVAAVGGNLTYMSACPDLSMGRVSGRVLMS